MTSLLLTCKRLHITVEMIISSSHSPNRKAIVKLIFQLQNQRFFIEPCDPSTDSTLANARITEMLLDLCEFVELEMVTKNLGRKGRTRERNFYEVTFVGGEQLAKAYMYQQTKAIPIILWTCLGRGPMKRYVPEKVSLSELLKSGLIRGGVAPKTQLKK